jgi:hypothetical protein
MAESGTETKAPEEAVRLASVVIVKRTKSVSPFAQGAYGTNGVIALTDTRLIFMQRGAVAWEIQRSEIANVKKPWYGMGTYVTFEVKGAFYGLAFNQRSTDALASAASLAVDAGALGLGMVADAMAVARLRGATKAGKQWFEMLRRSGK